MVLKKHYQCVPKIKVRLFANFREFTKKGELDIEGNTIRDLLEKMCRKYPGLEDILFKDGILQPYVNIFLNKGKIIDPGGLDISLEQDDEIAIFPPVSGG